jgi:hypothetical protein
LPKKKHPHSSLTERSRQYCARLQLILLQVIKTFNSDQYTQLTRNSIFLVSIVKAYWNTKALQSNFNKKLYFYHYRNIFQISFELNSMTQRRNHLKSTRPKIVILATCNKGLFSFTTGQSIQRSHIRVLYLHQWIKHLTSIIHGPDNRSTRVMRLHS